VNAPRPSEVSVAVIVPVLNEAENITALIDDLGRHAFSELVVVDGGSDDGTPEIVAATKTVRLIRTQRGRGSQLNAGATAVSADVLLFLHADTRLPKGALQQIRAVLSDERILGGCFRLAFDVKHPMLSLYSRASAFDTVFTTFGDQAYFVRAAAFRDVDGFPDWPFLEDVELRRRLRRRGKFVKAHASVVTSARRFRAEGILRRQLLNALILCAFLVGVPAQRLARWYAPRAAAKILTDVR
jgi:rSAM/selenodomain-associated transferase 2